MFAWMAIVYYWLFPSSHLDVTMAVYGFIMQIAMILGFFTAPPANAWLIQKGWKEKMPPVNLEQLRAGLEHQMRNHLFSPTDHPKFVHK